MSKSRDAFRTISEVAELLDTPAHVLRFWETKFSQVKPVKRAGGRRYYRPNDVALLAGIRQLLHDDGLTIKGVQKVLREQGVKHVAGIAPPPELLDDAADVMDAHDAAEQLETAVAMPRVQESATVLPFTPPSDAPVLPANEVSEAPGAAEPEVVDVAAPLFPEFDEPEPHVAAQSGFWDADPEASDSAADADEPGAPEAEPDSPAAAPAIPALPDLSALAAPAPGPLARLAALGRIDAAGAAELAPQLAALRAFVAARQGGRMT
ncbi:MerR family transcriptional regulator [Salipiger sp. H15]|uniref:MerR family transcriptional regulator n=1 Tax=Alloyangia sp. H15 TaxID=3029062 RepID=A0AAU8AE47_9RHOB